MRKPFDKNKKSHSEKPFGNRPSYREFPSNNGKFKAVCGQCGSPCEIPFKPSNHRPVLCHNCFRRDGDSTPKLSERHDHKKRFGSESRSASFQNQDPTQKLLASINSKLDKILDILED